MTICVLMCGGMGSRIITSSNISENRIEKPLILLNNKPLIEHIIDTILNGKKQFKIFAAVSSNTKETEGFIKDKYSNKINILKTQGSGYSEDFTNIIRHFKKESHIKEQGKHYTRSNLLLESQEIQNKIEESTILFLPIDLPLISTKTIERIMELKQGTALISIVIDKKVITENGFYPTHYTVKIDEKDYCYTGIAVVSMPLFFSNDNTNLIGGQIEEEPIIFNDPELAFNINTMDDLERTKEYFSKRIKNQKTRNRLI